MHENEHGKRKRSLDCARDDDTRQCSPRTTFIPLRCQPPPLRGAPPSKGRRENAASRTPHEDGLRYENTVPPHSSFRAKARNLFRSREGKGCERSSKRGPPAPCAPKKTVFHADRPRRKRNTANEKDPSAALGMTIREYRSPARLSSRCDANLRPFGVPPSKGRRENAASRAPHTDGLRYENAAPPHSSLIPVS